MLYGVNSNDDGLSIIDLVNGKVTFIGPLDPDPYIFVTPIAMAVRPSDGKLFVWNNSDDITTGVLLTVDKCMGLATPVDSTTPPQGQMAALAFGPDGTLYGFGKHTEDPTYGLYTIDTSTGVRTLFFELGSLRIGGADFDASGTLYGVELTQFHAQKLVTIDLINETVNIIVTLSENIIIGSIVFDEYGTLIGSGYNITDDEDIIFDIDTATGTVSNSQAIYSSPQGMAFAPPCEEELLVPDQINELVLPDIIYRECWSGPESWSLYQSFTPSVSPLAAVDLMFIQGYNFPETGFSITIQIRAGSVNGEVVGTATTLKLYDSEPTVRFHFSPPIPVIPGQTYVIEWITPDTNHILYMIANKANTYDGGKGYGCLKIPMDPEEDFIFTTYSIVNTSEGPGIVVQPEDASTGMTPVTLTFTEVTAAGTTSQPQEHYSPRELECSSCGHPLDLCFQCPL